MYFVLTLYVVQGLPFLTGSFLAYETRKVCEVDNTRSGQQVSIKFRVGQKTAYYCFVLFIS